MRVALLEVLRLEGELGLLLLVPPRLLRVRGRVGVAAGMGLVFSCRRACRARVRVWVKESG